MCDVLNEFVINTLNSNIGMIIKYMMLENIMNKTYTFHIYTFLFTPSYFKEAKKLTYKKHNFWTLWIMKEKEYDKTKNIETKLI